MIRNDLIRRVAGSATVLALLAYGASDASAQPAADLDRLERQALERAGDPGFDYRLGTAALAAGDAVAAVRALRRVVAVEPGHLAARISLARAYVQLGELEKARNEAAAAQAAVPAGAGPVLDRYVAVLEAAAAEQNAVEQTARWDDAYRHGVASLDAGELDEAVAAFRRILEARPDHVPARAELGRAYAMLGDYGAARRELETVAGEPSVPSEVRENIDRYVTALDTRPGERGTRVDGYVSLESGYDSNVNNATDEERILIPAFAGLGLAALSPDAVGQSDGFTHATGRLSIVHGLSARRRLIADFSASARDNFDAGAFDQLSLGMSLGHAWETPAGGTFTFAAQTHNFRIDGDVFREVLGVLAGWSRTTHGGIDISTNVQVTDLGFPDDPVRDARRTAVGASAGSRVGPASYVFGGVYGGREDADDARFDHLSQRFVGARVGLESRPAQRIALFASLIAERQAYEAIEPLFMAERRTRRVDLQLGLRHRLKDRLAFTAAATYTRADSNIVLFDYRRTTASVGVEFGF